MSLKTVGCAVIKVALRRIETLVGSTFMMFTMHCFFISMMSVLLDLMKSKSEKQTLPSYLLSSAK